MQSFLSRKNLKNVVVRGLGSEADQHNKHSRFRLPIETEQALLLLLHCKDLLMPKSKKKSPHGGRKQVGITGRLGGGIGQSLQSRVGKAKQSRFVPYKKSGAEKKNKAIGAEKKAAHKKEQRNLIERLEAKQKQKSGGLVILQQSSFDPSAAPVAKSAFAFAKPTFSLGNDAFTAVRHAPEISAGGSKDNLTFALDNDAEQTAEHERQRKVEEQAQNRIASHAAKQIASGQGGGAVNVFGALADSSAQSSAGGATPMFQFSAPTFAFGGGQPAAGAAGDVDDL